MEKVGSVAYKLELPKELSRVHNTFHVKCYADEPLVLPLDRLHIDDKLHFVKEPVKIMDCEVKQLKQSRILIVKVRWNSRRGPEFTWEREDQFRKKYPYLFTKTVAFGRLRDAFSVIYIDSSFTQGDIYRTENYEANVQKDSRFDSLLKISVGIHPKNLSAEDRYRGIGYDRGKAAEHKQVKIMVDRRDKVQAEYHVLELQPERPLSELVWTLKDVRYILSLKRRLILVGQLDEEGYHVGFGDQQWKVTKGSLVVAHGNKRGSLYMVEDWWFGEAEESLLHNVKEDKETAETAAGVAFGVAERLSRTFRAESTGLRAEAPKMFWADSVSTTYLIYRIPYVPIGLRILEEELRGKDTSLTHLKVFGCDSFVKVKDICGEAMQCTFIGSASDEMRHNFQDTKSHHVIRSRDITLVDSIYEASGSFKDSGRSYEEYSEDGASSKDGGSETPQRMINRSYSEALSSKESVQWKKAIFEEMVSLEKNQTCSLVRLPAGKKASQRLWMFKVKEEQNSSERYEALLNSWKEEPCRDVHQVGDEIEVEVLRSSASTGLRVN
ncbi:retrovirus-related pol polyprotein from transposon TNT 1-94 [Tanacetum coccineum]